MLTHISCQKGLLTVVVDIYSVALVEGVAIAVAVAAVASRLKLDYLRKKARDCYR